MLAWMNSASAENWIRGGHGATLQRTKLQWPTLTESLDDIPHRHVALDSKSAGPQESEDTEPVLNGDDNDPSLVGQGGSVEPSVRRRCVHERATVDIDKDGKFR